MPAMNRLEIYRDLLRERDIPEHAADRILRLARPRIELRPAGYGEGPVVGRYGGHPSLPKDFEPPVSDFIASVDCATLPPGALEIPLPQDGQLLFFGNMSDWQWDDEDRGGSVVYIPAGTTTAERTTPEDDGQNVAKPFPLHGYVDWNMPGGASFDVFAADAEGANLFDEYEMVTLGVDDSGPGELTLGGYACPAWDDPCLRRWPDDDDEAWLLLAQSTYGFADTPLHGTGFWMIRRQDLAQKNFENVKYVMDVYN